MVLDWTGAGCGGVRHVFKTRMRYNDEIELFTLSGDGAEGIREVRKLAG